MPDDLDKLLENANVQQRMRVLLEGAGAPLEVRTAQIVERMAARLRKHKTSSPWTQRVVYGKLDGENALREIDQLVQFYEEVEVSDKLFGFSSSIEVPIECKHRDNTAFVGVEYGLQDTFLAGTPVGSSLVGSSLLQKDFMPEPSAIRGLPLVNIALIEFDGKNGPKAISKEQLVYKAGSALYDYVLHQWSDVEDGSHLTKMLQDSGILEEAGIDLAENFLSGASTKTVVRDFPKDAIKKFNKLIFPYEGMGVLHFGLQRFIPVICVDGPVYRAKSDLGAIGKIRKAEWLVTAIRPPGWPGKARLVNANLAPEAIVVVCQVESLEKFLMEIDSWHKKVMGAIHMHPKDEVRLAPLEAAIANAEWSTRKNESNNSYSSDYDRLMRES